MKPGRNDPCPCGSGMKYKKYDENHGNFYLYTRIITHRGISFGSGLNFIFLKTDAFIQEHIKYHKENYSPYGEIVRFTQLYNRISKKPHRTIAFDPLK